VRWAWAGHDPVHGVDAIGWMPKQRYVIMRDYLPTRGGLALTMMKATCTVQANVDFASEVDMGKKLRAGMALASVVTAMFANSPLRSGRPCGHKSFRAHIWTDTDPDRTGLLPWTLGATLPTYEQWVTYALDAPMFFFQRDDAYVACAGLPFRRFMTHGHQGYGATMADWELHLSTLFPEVRLKTYLEMRSADCVKPELIPALPALWKGILYDGTALDAAWDLVRAWSLEDRHAHRADTARLALAAPVPQKTYETVELAKELLDIAVHGLKSIAAEREHADESIHLAPLEQLTRSGRSPADETLAWYARTSARDRDFAEHYR
jgi:glutamate--cysteine ligase